MNNQVSIDLAERAQSSLDRGDLQQAIKLYTELRTNEPENAEAWLMSGALHSEMGNSSEAVADIQKAISINPNYPEAILTLAHMYKATGALDDSYDAVKKALELDADYDEAWVFLGMISCDLKRFEEAEIGSREAIKRWPENTQAHVSLATALCNLGRDAEAEPIARHAVQLAGGSLPQINPLLGRILIGEEKYDDAEFFINASLVHQPDNVVLLLNLATIKLRKSLLDEAESMFLKIIDMFPDEADAWSGLAETYNEQYKLEEAKACYRKAITLGDTNSYSAYKLAQLLEITGQFEEAETTFRNILEQYPGQLDTVGALAGLLEKAGKLEDAVETLEPVLSIAERSVPVALAFQKLCQRMDRCDDAINYINELLQQTILDSSDVAALRFALGAMYDNEGNYSDAFRQYSLANEITDAGYNPADYTSYIDSMISVFSVSALQEFPVSSNKSEIPVFILGMPRSGTSLVEQILSNHTDVFGAGELRHITNLTEHITGIRPGSSFPENMKYVDQVAINCYSDDYLDTIEQFSRGKKRVTDKLPHNFQYIGLIHAMFPKARIIHCKRNPLDTCLSCYSMDFFGHHPYTADLASLGRHYKDYERLMSHWKTINIPMLDVNYEDLIKDTEKVSRQIIDYCGLEWQDECLHFYRNKNRTRTASYHQVRQPIYSSAIDRWKNYEPDLGVLISELKS